MASKLKLDQILDQITRQIVDREQHRYTRRMAAALCATYQIPAGRQLVMLLTSNRMARTNEDAVACWIEEQLLDPGVEMGQAMIGTLSDLLGRKLQSIEAELWSSHHG